ncbi:cytochrome c oxidase assembly protein [Domibacillus antri]|uniref:Cytochrome c oxidase assembly protein n=1 Tax=Domibacillus antri TaxID=1714264 RepID=A0A1Q8Q480_9BACI|nr:SCO family protein [Domibacillus antri]OLN22150.1 cytochrome c oxidase assembly protein [Domibacillus antri]
MYRSFPLIIFISVAVLIIAGCSSSKVKGNMDVEVSTFSHVNQEGKQVSLKDLKGTVWLASFIFTNCKTVCPPMTKNMSDLQKQLNEEGVEDYRIISFSVDPKNDTPEKLKEYISKYEADDTNWDLLTGYDDEYISDFAKGSFQTLVMPEPESDQIMHGTSFYLINKEGRVIKSYSGNIDVPFDEIVSDVKQLSKE